MNTKTLKILTIIATIILTAIMGVTTVYGFTPSDIKADGNVSSTTELQSIGGKLLGVLQAVGVILAVIILTVIGIKYMMGSAEEKAEYKKTMMPYIIGAIIVFAAPTIANLIYKFGTDIAK